MESIRESIWAQDKSIYSHPVLTWCFAATKEQGTYVGQNISKVFGWYQRSDGHTNLRSGACVRHVQEQQ